MSPGVLDDVQKDLCAKVTQDSVSLIWLADQSKAADAVAALQAHKADAHIETVYGPDVIATMFGDATKDPRVPDIIVQPMNGYLHQAHGKQDRRTRRHGRGRHACGALDLCATPLGRDSH